jgi:dTDP-4-amino-4,6-dideoxygalactose transaminase
MYGVKHTISCANGTNSLYIIMKILRIGRGNEVITPENKAVIALYLQGQMCAIDQIKSICYKHGLFLIEDCVQLHLSDYKGVRAGLT